MTPLTQAKLRMCIAIAAAGGLIALFVLTVRDLDTARAQELRRRLEDLERLESIQRKYRDLWVEVRGVPESRNGATDTTREDLRGAEIAGESPGAPWSSSQEPQGAQEPSSDA